MTKREEIKQLKKIIESGGGCPCGFKHGCCECVLKECGETNNGRMRKAKKELSKIEFKWFFGIGIK